MLVLVLSAGAGGGACADDGCGACSLQQQQLTSDACIMGTCERHTFGCDRYMPVCIFQVYCYTHNQ